MSSVNQEYARRVKEEKIARRLAIVERGRK